MANNGVVKYTTLKEVATPYPPGTPTGNTKANVSSDPDYIAPGVNTDLCPVTYDTECPTAIATGGSGTIEYEFNLENPTLNNPAVDYIIVLVKNGVTTITSTTFPFPNPTANYFSGTFSGLASGARTLDLQYYNASNTLLDTCTAIATVTVT